MSGLLNRLFLKDLGLKVLSLLFAVILWYMAAGQERTEVGFVVPVEFASLPDSVSIEGKSLEFLHVRLRGSRGAIQELTPQQIRATIDLSTLRPGDNYLTISAKDIHIPKGVELVNVSPPQLYAKAVARRLVPVQVNLRGRPADGFRVIKVTAIPANISIIGPASKVQAVQRVDTYPISVKNATGSINIKADLIPPDPEARFMELKSTEVSIEIEGFRTEKTIPNVPVTVGDPSAILRPSQVSVRVAGPFNLMEGLDTHDISATVDLSNPREQVFSRKVHVTVPEGLTVTAVNPAAIQITLNQNREP